MFDQKLILYMGLYTPFLWHNHSLLGCCKLDLRGHVDLLPYLLPNIIVHLTTVHLSLIHI